ncbi:hypothetical protein [Acetobacter pomorum]|nr:hypothetical protein [Acetobacter pomorum]KGB25096.1 hypothetical protein ApDm4_1143 [Acetobacter pomorum]
MTLYAALSMQVDILLEKWKRPVPGTGLAVHGVLLTGAALR